LKLEGKALPVVLFIIFLDILGMGILIPVLPQLMYEIFVPAGYGEAAALILLGWLTASYPLFQFLTTPVLGQLSDRYGRRPVLLASLAGTALGYLITVIGILTRNIPLIFAGRILDGITGGNISVARAVIADVSLPAHRARNFGLIGAMFGVGLILGPVLGARLATPNAAILEKVFGGLTSPHWFGTATPFWFAAALSLLTVVLVFLCLPETHGNIDRRMKLAWTESLTHIRKAAARPRLRVLFTAEFLFWGGFTFFMTFFQILLIEKLGFRTKDVGDFFAYIGICVAVSQAVLVPLAVKRYKIHNILRFSLPASGISLFLLLLPTNTAGMLAVGPLLAVFGGMVMATAPALVSLSATHKEQGEVLGIEASLQALAQAVPAIISGYVATMGVDMPVIVGGLCIMAGALVFISLYKVPKDVDRREAHHELPAERVVV
jgi:DHA1 family tetracycline resistance protein-like MFS transporter